MVLLSVLWNASGIVGRNSAFNVHIGVEEEDCLVLFEEKLIKAGHLTKGDAKELFKKYEAEAKAAQEEVRSEPEPTSDSVWDHFYANNESGDWRTF